MGRERRPDLVRAIGSRQGVVPLWCALLSGQSADRFNASLVARRREQHEQSTGGGTCVAPAMDRAARYECQRAGPTPHLSLPHLECEDTGKHIEEFVAGVVNVHTGRATRWDR